MFYPSVCRPMWQMSNSAGGREVELSTVRGAMAIEVSTGYLWLL
jgi:hypothetical protein